MNTQVVLCLTLAFLLYGGNAITISFTNNCQFTVWPATLNAASSPALSTTGFELATGASRSVDVPSPWSGRFWARTGCTGGAGSFKCATADCGSGQVECNGNGGATPATLAEITVAPNRGQDFYDVSNVDGFNLPISMAAQGGTGDCKVSSCKANINAQCPNDLKVTGSDGSVIACKSACVAFGNPEYCCTGEFNDPNKCKPTSYSQFFSNQCPEAYSYAYDDLKGTFTCNGGPNYAITFCIQNCKLSVLSHFLPLANRFSYISSGQKTKRFSGTHNVPGILRTQDKTTGRAPRIKCLYSQFKRHEAYIYRTSQTLKPSLIKTHKTLSINTRVVLCLALAFLFHGGNAATITFTNKCPFTVWPGTLNGASSPQLSTTGFELASGASSSVDVPSPWSGRFWARTGCSSDSGKFACATADCASGQVSCNGAGPFPPATLIELTVAANGGQDFYDVSNVDGFNLPMPVAPHGGTGDCKVSSCPANINTACPDPLKVVGSDGTVIACKSACLAFNEPQYCCTGDFDTPEKCPPTQYSQICKAQCPDAYSYAYDDKTSTFACFSNPIYVITFCP